jgi:hypothetical protein
MPAVAHKAANGQVLGVSGAFEGGASPPDCIIAIQSGDMPLAIAGEFTMPATIARMARLAIVLLSKEMARLRRIVSLFHRGRPQRNRRFRNSNGILIEFSAYDDQVLTTRPAVSAARLEDFESRRRGLWHPWLTARATPSASDSS